MYKHVPVYNKQQKNNEYISNIIKNPLCIKTPHYIYMERKKTPLKRYLSYLLSSKNRLRHAIIGCWTFTPFSTAFVLSLYIKPSILPGKRVREFLGVT